MGPIFILNDIQENMKGPLLLTAIGSEFYHKFNHILCRNVQQKTYKEHTAALSNYYAPRFNEIAERYKFKRSEQQRKSNNIVSLKTLTQSFKLDNFLN